MRLAPRWYSPHLVAAEWLINGGHRDQAWLEAREAERAQVGHAGAAACRLLVDPSDASEGIRIFEH